MMKQLSALLCALVLPACFDGAPTKEASTTQHVDAPNAVTTWHANAQSLVAGFTGRGNAAQAYTAGLIQVAVYDAVVAIRGGYAPFIATGITAPEGADLNAAIATAAFRVGYTRVNVGASRATYLTQYNDYMLTIPDGQAKSDGTAVGEAVAQAVLAARANDNFYNTSSYSNPFPAVGVWQSTSTATPYATAGANDYTMRFVTPLTAASPSARRPPSPVNLQSALYARDLEETQETGRLTGSTRTTDMTDAAQFWSESGFTLWSRNARAIVTANALDELEAARAFAIFGVATGDGMLACFEAKYHYMFWRPFQGIHRAGEDKNQFTQPEPNWTPLVRANHPEYPSGHSCYGGAATTALRLYFGSDFAVTLSSTGNQVAGWPVVPTRSYGSLTDIVEDTGNARVWSGLHFRSTMNKSTHWIKDLATEAVCGNFGTTCEE